MQAVDPRVTAAASYWARQPGNARLAAVFDRDDAEQEAAMALLAKPDALQIVLQRRILDAVQGLVYGYKAKRVPMHVPMDDWHATTDCTAVESTLTAERVRILQSLRGRDLEIVERWIDGQTDVAAGAAHGVTGETWRWHRKRLFDRLQRRGL
jgi:DNA-binding CsgD family transcriptional regulator